MIQFTLPWPPRELSPNSRPHWAAKARKVKSYRRTAWALLCHAQNSTPGTTARAERFELAYTFCPPTRRSFDLDNALAQMKAATDGIAQGLCVNDANFTFQVRRGEVVKGGAVRVQLTWAA